MSEVSDVSPSLSLSLSQKQSSAPASASTARWPMSSSQPSVSGKLLTSLMQPSHMRSSVAPGIFHGRVGPGLMLALELTLANPEGSPAK